jgi:small subunit ribosomal protein S7e
VQQRYVSLFLLLLLGTPRGSQHLAWCLASHSSLRAQLTLLSHPSLTRELEKKFSDRHVLILASRRILPRPKRSNRSRTSQTQKRPRSRTLTAVHDAILTDLVYPVEIVGKRLRTKEDGSKVLKVVLDEKEKNSIDHRLDTYSEVYRRLTGRGVNFEFPAAAPEY